MREITFKSAVLETIVREMRRDPRVLLIGEDVGAAGGVFRQTEGLFAEFGPERVIDTPISEPAIVGLAVGAAMAGSRPIVEIMFGDFVTLVMDQLVNQAAKTRYMSAGQYTVPMVLRTAVGVGGVLGPQHSQSLYAWLCHVPGLKVVFPSSPGDAAGLFASALRDEDPVVFFEDRMLYNAKGPVPEGEHLVPIGKAVVRRNGRDATLVAIGRMVEEALRAAALLAAEGIDVEVIDLRSLLPWDVETVVGSVQKTGRAVVLDAATCAFGVSGEIAATIAAEAFDWLDAPVQRLGAPFAPVPASRVLESLIVPSAVDIASAVRRSFRDLPEEEPQP